MIAVPADVEPVLSYITVPSDGSMAPNHRNDTRPEQDGAAAETRDRQFSDMAGVVWRAYERRRPGQPPALVFESKDAVRLVRDFPANWHTLPRAALEALSWGV